MSGHSSIVSMGWDTYRLLVVPANAGPNQVRECRRAFYAGAVHLFTEMLDKAATMKEADAMAQLSTLRAEFEAFARAMKEGLA